VLSLSAFVTERGTQLDQLWIAVFQCVIQLVMAANKNIKHHYITISAKVIHCSAEIVRAIEFADKKEKCDFFSSTSIKLQIKEVSNAVATEHPKKLMMSTRMSIGVWPPPDAVADMIKEAANLASACKDLVMLGNLLGYFPVLEKPFEVSFQAFEEGEVGPVETGIESQDEKDKRLKGGLNYSEYKRQNNLRLIESLSKGYDSQMSTSDLSYDPKAAAAAFTASLDALLKQFVMSVSELKSVYDQHLQEEYVTATSILNERAELLIEEILSNEMLKDMSEEIKITDKDAARLTSASGVRFGTASFPHSIKALYLYAIEEVRTAARNVMERGRNASAPRHESTAEIDMLQCTIPCVIAVKKLVVLAKEASSLVRDTYSEERKKRDMWKKECLQNERVKQLFQMWESQVLGDVNTSHKKVTSALSPEELKILEEPVDGLVIEEVGGKRYIKGGKLGQLVLVATHYSIHGNPIITIDEEFTAAFLMTHHSFTTSAEVLDQLLKRYEITPPYGLTQRLFEIYLDKKVVQVRLRVCNILLAWIRNHFEEDFVDNEPLLIRYRS
jgi:RasGEF N-terminal motif